MKNNHFLKKAFTQIELIFVILIIGILAAIAIPKLAATRNDAKLVVDVSNMSVCIQDSAANYTATGSIGTSPACDDIVCYRITDSDPGNFTVVTDTAAASYCSDIVAVGGHLAITYSFKSTGVVLD